MGDTIRVLAIDNDESRVKRIKQLLSEQNLDLNIVYSTDLKSLIQLIEVNTFDCIISPHDTSILSKTELRHRISKIISLPVIHYLGNTRLPSSTQKQYEFYKDLLPEDDVLSYQLLADRIKQNVKRVRDQENKTTFCLPDSPRVIVRGRKLFIVDEDGREEFWGYEPEDTAVETARQMEIELKAANWVKSEIERFLFELTQLIKTSEVPEKDVPDIIFEGYRSLLFSFKKIHDYFSQD